MNGEGQAEVLESFGARAGSHAFGMSSTRTGTWRERYTQQQLISYGQRLDNKNQLAYFIIVYDYNNWALPTPSIV